MGMRKTLRCCALWMLMFALLFAVLPNCAYAAETDPFRLSLRFYDNEAGKPIPGTTFKLYYVAEPNGSDSYKLVKPFSDSGITLVDLDSAGMQTFSEMLATYAEVKKVEPVFTAVTDANGMVEFTADSQPKAGMYLVTGTKTEANGKIYVPQSFLLYLPYKDETGELDDILANVKFTTLPGGNVKLTVRKVWNDGGSKKRPTSIKVALVADGKRVETVTLNKDNNWKHTWEVLDGTVQWSICEVNVPKGYTKLETKEGTTYIIKNTAPADTPTNPSGRLPQTGQLWWPVSILACGGLVLILAGLLVKRRDSE